MGFNWDRTLEGLGKSAVGLLGVMMIVAGCGASGANGVPDSSGAPASDSATLFKASNLSKVLPKVEALLGGEQITAVKIEPRDVKVISETKVVTVDYNDNSLVVNAAAGYAPVAFGIAAVDPAAVAKAVAAFESQSGQKQTDISYIAVTRTGGFQQFASGATTGRINKEPFVLIFSRHAGEVYAADVNGGHVRMVRSGAGGSVPASGGAGGSGSAGSSVAACIAKAGTDAAKIQACVGQ